MIGFSPSFPMANMSIVIPAFNEEAAIAAVILAIKALPIDAEIIVVDDGSTDRTLDHAMRAGAKVLRQPQNAGYGYSLKRGFAPPRAISSSSPMPMAPIRSITSRRCWKCSIKASIWS